MARTAADVAVDLGTAMTRIVVRGRGIVLEEPSVVATEGGEVLSVGADARRMLGRASGAVTVVRPIRGGVVADFDATEHLLRAVVRRVTGRALLRPRLIVCVPAETTEVERRAVQESARAAGGREVTLVAAPLAAALGAGLPITEPVASMVVDVGAGKTEVAVISLGGMVVQHSIRVAGDALDEALAWWLRSRHNLSIAEQAAEQVKQEVGAAAKGDRSQTMRVRGRDVPSGKPREIALTSEDCVAALAEPVARIRDAVLAALKQTPPELASDIIERGVVLCGGTSHLRHLDRVLREATGLAVVQAEHPLRCAVLGAGRLLEDPALYARVAASA